MENKKTKLTISGNQKKSFKDFSSSKTQGKKTVLIEKKSSRPITKGNFNKSSSSKLLVELVWLFFIELITKLSSY